MSIKENKASVRGYFEKVLPHFRRLILAVVGGKAGADNSGVIAREIPAISHDPLAEEGMLFDRLCLWEQPSLVPATVDCLVRLNKPYVSQDSNKL